MCRSYINVILLYTITRETILLIVMQRIMYVKCDD